MTSLKKIVAAAGFTLSFAGLGCLANPASAMPASPVAPAAGQASPALEHVQYYGYGYPCVFPLRCGYYGPRYYGYYGRGFYGRGFYGRGGYGRGGYGRGYRR